MDRSLDTSLALPASDRPIVAAAQAAKDAGALSGVRHIVGTRGCGAALLTTQLVREGRQVLHLVANAELARRARADLAFLLRGLPLDGWQQAEQPRASALLYTAGEGNPYAEQHQDRRSAMQRAATLFHVARQLPWGALVITPASLLRRVPPRAVLAEAGVRLEVTAELDLGNVSQALDAAGYLRAPVVEDPGSFAIRGGLLDAWSPEAARPVRVELDGDAIERIREYDPDSQRTRGDGLEAVWLRPAREAVIDRPREDRARAVLRSLCDQVNLPSTKTRQLIDDIATGTTFFGAESYLPAFYELETLFDYLPAELVVVVEGATDVLAALDHERDEAAAGEQQRRGQPHFPVEQLLAQEDELEEPLRRRTFVVSAVGVAGGDADRPLAELEIAPGDAPTLATRDQQELSLAIKAARQSGGNQSALTPVVDRVEAWCEAGMRVLLTARVVTQAERLASLLSHRGLELSRWADDSTRERLQPGQAAVVVGELARGVVAPAEGLVLLTEEEIFGTRARRAAPKKRSTRALLEDLRALTPGDFVVHVEHGIGRYLGLEHKQVGAVQVDLLVVEYAGGDKLFLPVYRLNQIQKYSGGGDKAPRMDRLGGQTFAKTKAKVQRRVRQMADELLGLYAERNAAKKTPLDPPDDEYSAFEATFPFEETADQAAAISDVLGDLTSERAMDRLVCGDVGFGKTEVAIRAAFRVAMSGRQVALLCPTTVLAQQHFLTFQQRLSEYALNVGLLSRFVSKKDQTKVTKGLKAGSVDVVIGTHRLLSKDVHFKNLGLLVVDEEQRFGVTHKERIKQLKTSVDVLTLSATPIPRTLQLAIGGLRDMSIITTPPVDRRAIRTVTARFDDDVIREAIERELSRGGQVFYVYNRVEGLHERALKIRELVPRARVAVGHGQMTESALERTMIDFIAGEYDVLVATAIIESGLDIPRANTMIVDRADLFGLSQLYQLRGRVGRSSERAFCYLLVPPPSKLSDEARARIEALERYSDLGSGFHIASLDMEQRGAGDLLGADQSGFVASVGFDLFCQMLEEATQQLRGEEVQHEVDPDLSVDVDALLPENYIDEVGVRLSLYKRLASAQEGAEVAQIGAEMEDRFGGAPEEARRLVELMRIKTELRRLRVLGCEATARSVSLHLREDTPLDPVLVGKLVAKNKGYALSPDMRLTRRLRPGEEARDGLDLADRMLDELESCLAPA